MTHSPNRRERRSSWACLLLGLALGSPAAAVEPVNTGKRDSIAIEGYDAVAYHLGDGPTAGSPTITAEWNDATWRFATEANRDLFVAEPERYAPQYGGYCAWAVAQGKTAPIDPEAWAIVDDKLYLNYSPRIQRKWSADREANIQSADANWPRLLAED